MATMNEHDPEDLLIRLFARVDKIAFGAAVGVLSGVLICLATIIMTLRGGDMVGPNLLLLDNYFPGYTVTMPGAFLGFGYGFLYGSALGFVLAAVRNGLIFVYMAMIRARAERRSLDNFLDHL